LPVAQLLTPPTNYAIVQLPDREFPGVVFQGDSLNSLISKLEEAVSKADTDVLTEIVERLRAVRSRYETALQQAGIGLPYETRPRL